MKKIQKEEELINYLKQVDSWCLKNSIPYKELKNTHLDDSGKNKATKKHVSASGALLMGDGKNDALKKDSLVKMPTDDMSDDDYQKLLKVFKDAPTTGCATVLDMARQSSGYNPLVLADDGENEKNFKDYIKRILDAPFFHIVSSDSSEYNNTTQDWNKLIDFISDLYDGVTDRDKKQIVKSIKSLVNIAASEVDEKQNKSLFIQSTLEVDQEVIQLYIYSSNLTMQRTSKRMKPDSSDTHITIHKAVLNFYIDLWPSSAEKVMNKHVKRLDSWLDDNTAKEKTSKKVNLTCLKDG